MKTAHRIRLEVDPNTIWQLDGQSRICNWLYNHLLEEANGLRQAYRQTQDEATGLTLYTRNGLRDLIPELKVERPFLKAVHSSPLKNAARRLSKAVQDYQKSRKGKRKGPKMEWPKFRSWKAKWFSLEYDEPWKGYRLDGQTLTLQFGADPTGKRHTWTGRLTEALPDGLRASVKTLRMVKQAGAYYVVFTLESEPVPACSPRPQKVIALDPNHKNFAYGVGTDGQAIEIENMPGLKALDARIDELKARRDQCARKSVKVTRPDGSFYYKPSRRWEHFNDLLDKAYQKRRDQTKTYLFTVSNQLCKRYDVIGVGDYAPQGGGCTSGMRRAMNNRSLIGRFKPVMEWTATRSGKVYVKYDETGTTRTCHVPECRYVVEGGIPLDVREWTCPKCQAHHLRDENAAQNGLDKLREQNVLPRSGHTPVTITARWAWQVSPRGVLVTPRGCDGSGDESGHCQEIKPGSLLPGPDPVVAYA